MREKNRGGRERVGKRKDQLSVRERGRIKGNKCKRERGVRNRNREMSRDCG